MAILLDGKNCAEQILGGLKEKLSKELTQLRLSIVLVGSNPASRTYVLMKQKRAAEVGVKTEVYHFPEESDEEELCSFITALNRRTDGILVQLPLPKHLNKKRVLSSIQAEKDVDGLTPESLAKLMNGDESCAPATPKGIIRLLEAYQIPIRGKNCTIINHSELIGKPLALLFLNRGATVTICHKFTATIQEHTQKADILVTAVGQPNLITAAHIKDKAIVIDAGTAKQREKIVGDVEFEAVRKKASYITPVPGGVGPMTIAMLLETMYESRKKLSHPHKINTTSEKAK